MRQAFKWLFKVLGCLWGLLTRYKPILEYHRDRGGFDEMVRYIWAKFFLRGERNGAGLLDPFIYLFPGKMKYPYMYEGEFTTRCSLSCKVCERTYWKGGKSWAITYDDFVKFLDSIPNMKYFNPTGIGEFFLTPDWLKILQEFQRRHIYVNIVDNFAHRTDEQIRALVDTGVERVFISLDGATKKTYEKMRPGAEWETTIANIRKLQAYRKEKNSPIPEICYKYIICKDTYLEIGEFIEMIGTDLRTTPEAGGDNLVEFLGLMEFPEIQGGGVDTPAAVIQFAEWLGKKYGLQVMWAHHQFNTRKGMKSCVVWQEPFIIQGKYVLPCCAVLVRNDRERLVKYAMGDLTKNTFREIWDTPRYKKFRLQFKDSKSSVDPICQDCRVFNTNCREKERGITEIA